MSRYWAVVPAAGSGARMDSCVPKQYLPLADRSVIEWSLSALLDVPWIEGVVVTLAATDERFRKLPIAGDPRVATAVGGAERSDSVLNGLDALVGQRGAHDADFVLVHDAARPCLLGKDLAQLREMASDDDGGLLAAPVSETLKRAADGRVAQTLDRAGVWRAQTPQMFRIGLLRTALRSCRAQGVAVTDDASAMEHCGHRPRLVAADPGNLKITWPADLEQAEARLRARAGA